MIKKVLQWGIPITLIILLVVGALPLIGAKEESNYTFTIESKWQSVNVGRSSISEYNYFELCLVSNPAHCIEKTVRSDTWTSYQKGDNITFTLKHGDVYPRTFSAYFCSFLLFIVVGCAVIFALVGLLLWIYEVKL